MRVYIYTLRFNPVSGGGSHHTLEIYIRALRAEGHTPILTTFFSDDNNYAEAPCEMREERFRGGFFALQRHVAQRMRDHTDANVHFLYSSYLLWAGGLYKAAGGTAPVAASANNYTPGMGLNAPALPGGRARRAAAALRHALHVAKWRLWEKLIGARLIRKIDLFFFDSPVIREQYERFGYRARSSDIIPGPMEPASSATLPSPFSDGEDAFRVVYAGRLIADKGPDLLVKAAAGLPSAVHMHLIGTGNEEGAIRKLIRDNGLEARVFLHGWQSREGLCNFYRHAHVFAFPCRWPEPFGRVVAEALGCGLPVIATENSGPAWAAADAGLAIKKDDVADLAKRILFLFENPDARATYAARALARARAFGAETISRQFVAHLESLAGKK